MFGNMGRPTAAFIWTFLWNGRIATYGNGNVVAAGEKCASQVNIIHENDVNSLLAYLREQGVEEDLQKL